MLVLPGRKEGHKALVPDWIHTQRGGKVGGGSSAGFHEDTLYLLFSWFPISVAAINYISLSRPVSIKKACQAPTVGQARSG